MRRLMLAGSLVFLVAAGCTWMKSAAPSAKPGEAPIAKPILDRAQTDPAPPSVVLPSDTVQNQPAVTAAPPVNTATNSRTANATTPTDGRPPKHRATGTVPVPASKPVAVAAPSATAATARPSAAPPTLDMKDLEQRLRDTRAIGVFTKLSLKNQVDDLLNEFRTLYKAPNTRPTAQLRQHYDQLLLKVLSLLQDSDPPLASAISSSREAIWGILADPDKFAKI